MGISNWFRFNRVSDRPDILSESEREIQALKAHIKDLKAQLNVVNRERKRLLDRFIEPIGDYDQAPVGNVLGSTVIEEDDLYELKAGTVMEGEA